LDAVAQARLRLERTIREATERETFSLVYQPIYEVGSRRLTGFEALLRLRDADGAWIPPATFIPVAEDMRLIGKIGAWVLRQACRVAAGWPETLRVAVNLSPAQFDSGDLGAVVAVALRESGIAPGRLELEITEELLFANDARNMAALAQLKAMGIAIVMDDFGTGYSSLSYLWKFPFDKIKIDRSFMQELGREDERVATVVKTIIALGRELHMTVTVEGVETAEQLRFLEAADAQQAQGFWFSKPVSAEDTALLILDDLRRRGATAPPPAGGKPILQLVK
jgi:EAL domain-containing protein (putative c-di-GMP-specific phosphodiesterase class I)